MKRQGSGGQSVEPSGYMGQPLERNIHRRLLRFLRRTKISFLVHHSLGTRAAASFPGTMPFENLLIVGLQRNSKEIRWVRFHPISTFIRSSFSSRKQTLRRRLRRPRRGAKSEAMVESTIATIASPGREGRGNTYLTIMQSYRGGTDWWGPMDAPSFTTACCFVPTWSLRSSRAIGS